MASIKLYPPVKSVRKQKWGITSRVDTPTWEDIFREGVSQDFGYIGRLQYQYDKWGLIGHNGLDIVLYSGDGIFASHDSEVFEGTGTDVNGGIGIVLWNKEGQFKTIYWHNLTNLVKIVEKVKAGDLIAYGDSTGFSTSSHLHYGFKLTDAKGQTINKDNGYKGAVDPAPYLTDEIMKLTQEQVRRIYVLFGLGLVDENALLYWEGKELDDLLNTRLRDLSKELDQL